jgi:toxin-antitoxin system PIN domain toxin
MYLPDINVWVALAFPPHLHHQKARAWFDGLPTDQLCYFCRVSQMGFLRIVNNPKAVSSSAVTQDQAWAIYNHFMSHTRVAFATEPAGAEAQWRQLTNLPRFSTHIWTDAYMAAFARAADLEVVTFDQGFAQFKLSRCTVLS